MADGTSAQGMDAFTALGESVRRALSERGFTTPTEPQRRAIPPLAAGENALVIAPTGTGKTETAMLPVFDAIVRSDPEERDGLSALYITPLRALNRDMRQRLEWWGETLDVEIDVRHGDTTQYQRQKQANDPPDVLVTTPETLQAMLTGKKLRRALSDVRHVVVDEVHELASAKRGAQLTVGLERLRELAGPFQRIGLSATVGSPAEVGKFLTGDRGFEIVEVDVGSDVSFTVTHPEVTPEDEQLAGQLATDAEIASHVRAIRDIVREHESTLVFVNTRQTAEALGSRFKTLDEPIEVHHGSLSKDVRIDVEDRFKAGDLDALVRPDGARVGDRVVVTTGPAVAATALLATLFADRLRGAVSEDEFAAATERFRDQTVVRDALTAAAAGPVTAMHGATEGGVYGALTALGRAAAVGVEISQDRVPVQPGVDATCAVFGIDPWTALSVGTLVLSVDPAGVDQILDALAAESVPAADVGEVVDGSGLTVDGETVEPPDCDPFWTTIEEDAVL